VQFLTITLKARSIEELVVKRNYMKAVGNTQAETIALDERLRDEVKDLSAVLTVAAKEADAQTKVVEGQKGELQTKRDAQDAARADVATEIAKTDSLRVEVVARKDEFLSEQQTLQAQSDAITAQLKARVDAQRAAAAASGETVSLAPAAGGFVRPVAGPITSPFGYRIHPIYGTSILHAGVDIGADSGTPIKAAQAGVVVSAGWISGYGNATIIDHGGGVTTLYGHQSALGVSAGDKVSQGQTIGRVGCTGSCTGPHLHFEVRINGTPVDPMPYIS
jgi:murein DD-endopeptidase MepM/ murein hydrolase activator NlpD